MPGPAVIQLLGYPGAGKYTIGREVVRLLEEGGRVAQLLDNHATNDLIFGLAPRLDDGRIPEGAPELVWEIRQVVYRAIEALSPPEWSFVFTNFQPPRASPAAVERHRAIAHARGAVYLAVQLDCDPDEVLRRITAPDRRGRQKLVDVARAREVLAEGIVVPDFPELRRLDVTSLPPADAATAIVAMLG